jgi:hypothetical protein
MAFTVVSQATVTLTQTGSGYLPTDTVRLSYISPTDDTTRVLLDGTIFSIQEYQEGKTFTLPSESIFVQDEPPTTGDAKLLVTSLDGGVCINTESPIFTVTGLLLLEGEGGGGGGSTCSTYTEFKLGNSAANACSAGSTTTIYINFEEGYALQDLPSNLIIYSDSGCTTRLSSQFISDGTGVREWNNDNGTLGDFELCI